MRHHPYFGGGFRKGGAARIGVAAEKQVTEKKCPTEIKPSNSWSKLGEKREGEKEKLGDKLRFHDGREKKVPFVGKPQWPQRGERQSERTFVPPGGAKGGAWKRSVT